MIKNNQITVKLITEKFNGELIYGDLGAILENFSKDTRTINKDDVYIGIKGENFDGNLFYEEAFKNGAKISIIEKNSIKNSKIKKINGKTLIIVDDTIKLIQDLAHYKIINSNIPVIAITGSVGKTSTKDMIANILSTKYKVLKTEGNYNNHIGVPLTILRLKDEDIIVLEMGMNHFGEISLLSKIACPSIAIITNIGTAHIGNLGSRENIMKAKLEILDGMKYGTLIINNDNDLLHNNINIIKEKTKIITIGINNKSDYMATYIIDNTFSSTIKINNDKININVGGLPFVYNSLLSYAVAKELKLNLEDIKLGIENFKLSNNRMEKIDINGITIINDTYNASYDSVVAAIDLIEKSNYKRKILLLGDILELGDYSKKIHSDIGKYIKDKKIDEIILVGSEVKYIKNELIKNNYNKENIYSFESEELTYSFLHKFLKEGDIILVKGSHGMKLINIINFLRNNNTNIKSE